MKMELPGQSVPRPRISDPHVSPPRRLTLTLKCSKQGALSGGHRLPFISTSLLGNPCSSAGKEAGSLQRALLTTHCNKPGKGGREEGWGTSCYDPLLQWLQKLRRAHAFFSVDYPCSAGDELQILLQL